MSEKNKAENRLSDEVLSGETPGTAAVSSRSQSPRQRFWLTNDVLAVLLLLSFVGIVAAGSTGLVNLTAIPEQVRAVYLSVVVAATGWTFGEAAYRTWARK